MVARHSQRKLVAADNVDANSKADLFTVVLRSECQVRGHLTCKQLEVHPRLKSRADSKLGTGIEIFKGEKFAVEYWSKGPSFEFYLPPGDYTLKARDEKGWTHWVETSFSIAPGQQTLDLGAIDRPLATLKLLEGEPAPELSGVVAWKNSQPLKLADLKGQVVLLDFFGYWCYPCVSRMPKLFEMYDKYREQGLIVVGVHVDLGDDEQEKVDTAEILDKRLAESRKDLWNGRDIPFPVALVSGRRTPYGEGIQGGARGAATARYGVMFFPTQVLIDREGRVVGNFYPSDENIRHLEELLSGR